MGEHKQKTEFKGDGYKAQQHPPESNFRRFHPAGAYPPGANIKLHDGTIYHIAKDGSWRRVN